MRRPVVILALAAVVHPLAPASAAAVPVLVIDGKGHGHGVGMAQDGALAMGRKGATTAQILNQFYPVHVFKLQYCNMFSYCPSTYVQSYSHS